jgi:hypothetical protein
VSRCDGVNYVSVARSAAYALAYKALVEKRDPYECWVGLPEALYGGLRDRAKRIRSDDDRGLSLLAAE